jgi:manganese transport protein
MSPPSQLKPDVRSLAGVVLEAYVRLCRSALVQTRSFGYTEQARRSACRYNLIDSVVALNGAMFVNLAIPSRWTPDAPTS